MPHTDHGRRIIAALLLAGCSKAAPPAAPPPPEVRIMTLATQPVVDVIDLPGRLQAVRTSEVRARVDGIVPSLPLTRGNCARN